MMQRIRWCSVVAIGMLFAVPVPGAAQRVAVDRPRDVARVFSRPVTITLKNIGIKDAIDALAQSAKVRISYQADVIASTAARVSLTAEQVPLGIALDHVLHGAKLYAVPVSDGLIVIKSLDDASARALQSSIQGSIVDAKTQQPLRGATITLDDATHGVVSGAGGEFRIDDVAPGQHILRVKLLGYTKTEKSITTSAEQTTSVKVFLEPGMNTLDQVVVTGTIIPTELKAVPNAITVITAKQIEERGITQIQQLFRGDVPGLFAINAGTAELVDRVQMYSRGASGIGNESSDVPYKYTNTIKTYIDGVEMYDPNYLSQIDPRSIERIEILTGPQASTIYGSNALNGVMQIFTKRGRTATPEVTLNAMAGVTQNNQGSALAPSRITNVSLSGKEGRLGYTAGASWDHVGDWNPAKKTERYSLYGSAMFSVSNVVIELPVRYGDTQNQQRGYSERTDLVTNGLWTNYGNVGGGGTRNSQRLIGQTLGLKARVTPFSWWSHEFEIGVDGNSNESVSGASEYRSVGDSMGYYVASQSARVSERYTTAMRIPLGSILWLNLTAGGDHWRTHGIFYQGYSMAPSTAA